MIKIFGITIHDKIIYTILTLAVAYLVYRVLLSIVNKSFNLQMKRNKADIRRHKTTQVIISNVLKYTFGVITIFTILGILGVNAGAIIASIGVVGLAFGLAIQDILKDIMSGTFILIENQYAIGDIVMIGNFKGEVIFLGLKTTKLRGETGEIKVFSNRNIVEITNYSLGHSMLNFDLDLNYDNEEATVEKALTSLAAHLSKTIKNLKSDFKYLGIQKIGDKVTYRLSAQIDVKHQDEVKSVIWSEIKKTLDKNEIRR